MLSARAHGTGDEMSSPQGTPRTRSARPPARTSAGRLLRLGALLVACVAVLGAIGCVFPSRPYSSLYVANRGGVYFVGDRCRPELTGVGVTLAYLPVGSDGAVDLGSAVWHAVAEPDPVREFELFSGGQPGTRVIYDDGTRPLAQEVFIYLGDARGRWSPMWITLDQLEADLVGTGAGPMTWERFMAMPNGKFGC